MPMIPAGRVEVSEPIATAPQKADDFYPLLPNGSIDSAAFTNLIATDVAAFLDQEIDHTDVDFCAGVVFLAGKFLRYRASEVSDFTKIPRRFCTEVIFNLRYAKLIKNGEISGELKKFLDECDPETADDFEARLLFTLYVLIGAGKIARTISDTGESLYGPITSDPYIYRIQRVA